MGKEAWMRGIAREKLGDRFRKTKEIFGLVCVETNQFSLNHFYFSQKLSPSHFEERY